MRTATLGLYKANTSDPIATYKYNNPRELVLEVITVNVTIIAITSIMPIEKKAFNPFEFIININRCSNF
jgi:hypothetical protein